MRGRASGRRMRRRSCAAFRYFRHRAPSRHWVVGARARGRSGDRRRKASLAGLSFHPCRERPVAMAGDDLGQALRAFVLAELEAVLGRADMGAKGDDLIEHFFIARAEACCRPGARSEEHTSELQSLMRISYAVFCLKKQKNNNQKQ